MHHWLRRTHVITTVGGGFTGLAVSLAMLLGSWSQLRALAVLLVLGFCALCVWAITIGLRLSEGRDVTRQLQLFYLLQVPFLSTPAVSFHAGFGIMLYVGVLPNGQNIRAQLGADWNASVLNEDAWFFAVNTIPLLLLWLARRSNTSCMDSSVK